MTEQETENAGAVQAPGQAKRESPFDRFFVVELHAEGIGQRVTNFDEHVMSSFFRMDAPQKAKLEYLKVRFYRYCQKISSFRLDRRYVIPRQRLQKLEDEFRGIELEFIAARNEIYRELTVNWQKIVDDVYLRHPTFPLTRDEVDKMRPSSPEFVTMNYEIRSLVTLLSEMKGLQEVFDQDSMNPDIARRLENQRDLITAKIRMQYEQKMKGLQEQVDKLKTIAKKKGKRYEKLRLTVSDGRDDLEEMAEIIGEKDTVKARLEGMLEFLAEEQTGQKSPDEGQR